MDIMNVVENTSAQLVGRNACYYAIAAIGLNVQFGYTGLLNFGQAAFMAAGAYGLGMTVSIMGISMWWGIGIGIAFSIMLGLLMGIPTLRLRADYLAIVTIAVAEVVRLVVRSVKFRDTFGGTDGLKDFADSFQQVGADLGLNPGSTYGFWAFKFSGKDLWVLIVGWSLVAIFGVIVYLLMKSPWGRVLKAIREDEDAVRSLGKNVYSYKMQSLILGGVMGTFAGMILALGTANVQPDNFSRDLTFFILTALVLGGMARVTGSIVGPMLFWALYAFLDSFLRELVGGQPVRIGDFTLIDSTQIGPVVFMMMGLLLILLMTFRPQGLFGNRKEMAFDGGAEGAGVAGLSETARVARAALADVHPEPGSKKHDPILTAVGVRRNFGGIAAVDVDRVEVQRGSITALIGPNGAGKTTFFNLMTGFDKPDAGNWSFDGKSMEGVPPHRMASRGMVRTFQLTKSLTKLPVIENMKLGATGQRGERIWNGLIPGRWKAQEAEIEARADTLLQRFKLDHMRDEYAGSLSGGQRKLLEMARALMTSPTLVMLDEPMAGVNPALKQSLNEHVRGLRDEGMTVLFVEHDMDMVHDISDWVIVMAEGRVIAEGTPDDIASNPAVIDAYLGAHQGQSLLEDLEDDR